MHPVHKFAAFCPKSLSNIILPSSQPPIQWVAGAVSLGVKRPGREAGHSPPYTAEVKNAWSYTSSPQYAFMAWCLVKRRDTFTFTYICLLERKTEKMKTVGKEAKMLVSVCICVLVHTYTCPEEDKCRTASSLTIDVPVT
jgi:hypothetical protein